MNDMKCHTMFGYAVTKRLPLLAILTALLFGMVQEGYGQDQVRKYATRQKDNSSALLGLGGSIQNPTLVIDQNPQTASTLRFILGAAGLTYAEQIVDFNPNPAANNANNSPVFPAGTPITLKLSLPSELLGVLTGIIIQPIENLRNPAYNNVGTPISDANILALLSGAGESEITITPSVAYQGVRIRLTSALGLSGNMDFFHAYVMEDALQPLECEERNSPIDVLSGVRAGGISLANATGSVNDPFAAIDGDESTFSQINVGAQILSEVYHTTIFPTKSSSKDEVEIMLQNPAGGLLELSLLTGFSIQPYLGSNPVGSPINSNSNFLSLSLLPASGNKYILKAPVNGEFDRIEIKMGGVAEALGSLRIYEISRKLRIDLIDEPALSSVLNNCDVDLKNTIKDYDLEKYIYKYYASDGSQLTSSIITESGDYFIEATDETTGCSSDRVMVTASIIPIGRAEITITSQNN